MHWVSLRGAFIVPEAQKRPIAQKPDLLLKLKGSLEKLERSESAAPV